MYAKLYLTIAFAKTDSRIQYFIDIINIITEIFLSFFFFSPLLLRLERTSGDQLVQPLCSSMVLRSTSTRTAFRLLLKTPMEGDSTATLGNLFQCSVTITVKKFLLLQTELLCVSVCACFFLPLQCVPLRTLILAPPSWLSPFRYTVMRFPKSLLQAVQAQVPQYFLLAEMLQSFNCFSCRWLDSLQYVHASCTGKPRTVHSTAGEASPGLSGVRRSSPSTWGQCSNTIL